MSTEHDVFSISNDDQEKASWKGGTGAGRAKSRREDPGPSVILLIRDVCCYTYFRGQCGETPLVRMLMA